MGRRRKIKEEETPRSAAEETAALLETIEKANQPEEVFPDLPVEPPITPEDLDEIDRAFAEKLQGLPPIEEEVFEPLPVAPATEETFSVVKETLGFLPETIRIYCPDGVTINGAKFGPGPAQVPDENLDQVMELDRPYREEYYRQAEIARLKA